MTEKPRDWDKELADIDKLIASSPPPAAPARPAQGAPAASLPRAGAGTPPPAPPLRRRDRVATWLLLLLALGLTGALLFWPRFKECGAGLLYFLATDAILALVAVMALRASWTRRQGLAHVVALFCLAASVIVAAREVLPRTGYARASATWTCPAAPVPSTPPSGETPSGGTGV